jgi:hypothetical protein
MRLEAQNPESLESNKPNSVAWQQLVVSYGITTIAVWIFGFLMFEGQSDSNTGLIYKWNMWSPTLSIMARNDVGGSAHTAHFPNCISHFDQTVSGGGPVSETRSCLVRLLCSLAARIDRIKTLCE